MICKCRNCGKVYDEFKSRADWKGYCSQKCFHEKARELGYRKPGKGQTDSKDEAIRRGYEYVRSEYDIVKRANQIGNAPV
jgi:hypothetical protein